MPDATGRFRGYPAGRRGAQPGVPRPTVDARSEFGYIRIYGTTDVETQFDSWGDPPNASVLQRFCTYAADGVYPDLDEYPDGSIWDVVVSLEATSEDGTGYVYFGVSVFDDEDDIIGSYPAPAPYRVFGGTFPFTAGGTQRTVINVPPGGRFAVFVSAEEFTFLPTVAVQIDAHSVGPGFDQEGFDPG